MLGKLYIVLCWSKEALVGVYDNEEEALEIANAYAKLHKCDVNIQIYTSSLI